MPKRLELTAQQRTDAVLSLLRREEPTPAIARRYGISEQTLYRMRDQFLEGGRSAIAQGRTKSNARDQQLKELEREVAHRDRVIGELTIANRILKKHSDPSL